MVECISDCAHAFLFMYACACMRSCLRMCKHYVLVGVSVCRAQPFVHCVANVPVCACAMHAYLWFVHACDLQSCLYRCVACLLVRACVGGWGTILCTCVTRIFVCVRA